MLTLEACGPYGSPDNLILTWDSSVVNIYTTPSGGSALTQFVTPFHGFNGTNLYVEGISPGTTTLNWTYSAQTNCTDNIQVSVIQTRRIRVLMKNWTVTLCWLLLAPLTAQAIPIKRTDFAELLSRAPAVISAQVIAVEPSTNSATVYGYSSADLSVFDTHLRLFAVYKGNLGAQDVSVSFLRVPTAPDVFVDLKPGAAYVLFLQSVEAASLLFDVQNGAYQVEPTALQKTGVTNTNQLETLFQCSLSSSNTEVVVKALQALAYVGGSNSLPLIEPFIFSTNDELRLAAATAAVKLGDWKRIEDIVAIWDARSCGNDGFIGFRDHNLASSSWDAVKEVTAKESFTLVTQMLRRTKSAHIKRTLIHTLLNINDPQGVTVIAPFVEDVDNHVAYEAYVAIMRLKERPCVVQEPFEENKAAIVDDIRLLMHP